LSSVREAANTEQFLKHLLNMLREERLSREREQSYYRAQLEN